MSTHHWVRRTVLIVFCLGLLVAIGTVFTRVIAARVPEQRATLEKLITDRTGLAVSFDNVHFAWDIDGTSAVFERVELTDPTRGRVRVVAPELRVEFDTWDFLRHQQFSLGHVTLSSPDIDIIGEPEPGEAPATALRADKPARAPVVAEDEAALVRRFTSWAELMPVGRVEVEGARVHLFRRGERAARHHFTLSQAVVSRGSQSFNAFGTMLLSQDIGQSLFVSAKLDGVGARAGASGELRVIARRVFLDKFAPLAARGRGTLDARLVLREGRVHGGHWQLSARELELSRERRFDHFTVQGKLTRAQDDLLIEFNDLQLTRDARLERAPRLSARVSLAPGSLKIARVTANADRVPFMAAEFISSVLASRLEDSFDGWNSDWAPTAGELRALRYDSRAGTFSALLTGGELMRGADRARIANLAARVELAAGEARLTFDDSALAQVHLGAEPRELSLAGSISLRGRASPSLEFAALRLHSGAAELVADGPWTAGQRAASPLSLEFTRVDRALLADTWTLLAFEDIDHLAEVQGGQIVTGKMTLLPLPDGAPGVDWQRSRGQLSLADLASAGADVPRLTGGAGKLEFARGGAQLRLTAGAIEDLVLSDARIDWPRRGAPRLRATATGDLQSPLLRRALEEQGLERLAGTVTLEAEARGEDEMRAPGTWRVSAKLNNASIPLADGLPPVEKLGGTVRVAGGQLRGLALTGSWLGGPVEIESRRAGAQGVTSAAIHGVADAALLLKLLGQSDAAGEVSGRVAWSGSLQRRESAGAARAWQATVNGDLAGVESRLPEPFGKPRARALTVNAELRFDDTGLHEFEIESGRDRVRGRVDQGMTSARFDVQGVAGQFDADDSAGSRVVLDRLDLGRAPEVLAAAGALLAADRELAVQVTELRHANRGLGAIQASLARRADGVEFLLESAADSPHELDASGTCSSEARCRMEFTLDTRELRGLLASTELPAEWPTRTLRASGELAWRGGENDLVDTLTGNFELETQGDSGAHQLMASATLADGQIQLANVQGSGPESDQVFRGNGRVSLAAQTYDLTIDYEQVSLAASAVPTPARARLARAWTSLRGSAARRGWTDTAPVRRVQWHGTWD